MVITKPLLLSLTAFRRSDFQQYVLPWRSVWGRVGTAGQPGSAGLLAELSFSWCISAGSPWSELWPWRAWTCSQGHQTSHTSDGKAVAWACFSGPCCLTTWSWGLATQCLTNLDTSLETQYAMNLGTNYKSGNTKYNELWYKLQAWQHNVQWIWIQIMGLATQRATNLGTNYNLLHNRSKTMNTCCAQIMTYFLHPTDINLSETTHKGVN